jgi:ferredoxin-NADP reductase
MPWREAVIERIERRTPRVVSVFLRVSLGTHYAGQHVDVRLTAPDGYQALRSYSIASAPGAPLIELAIERLENGEVSPYFAEVAQPDDIVEIRGPLGGHFVWTAEDGGPLLLVAGGSGIAPLMAILRHRALAAPQTSTLLAYSVPAWEELIYRDELLRADASDPHFDLIVATTRERRQRPADFERRFDRGVLREILRRWDARPLHAYVCGSTPFVEAVATALVEELVPADRVRTERYGGLDQGVVDVRAPVV